MGELELLLLRKGMINNDEHSELTVPHRLYVEGCVMATTTISGEYIPPNAAHTWITSRFTILRLGGIVPAWKALIYHGAKARTSPRCGMISAGAIAAEAQKGAPSGQPKHAPPLVADSAKDKAIQDEASVSARCPWDGWKRGSTSSSSARRKRLNARAARKQHSRWRRRSQRTAPATMLDALSPHPTPRLH